LPNAIMSHLEQRENVMSDFEDAVMSHLSATSVDKTRLSGLTAAAARVNAAGLKGVRILTRGIPIPDWIRISGTTDKANVQKLMVDVLTNTKGLGGIHVFPYGIPFPDIYRVELDIGPGAPGNL
jgi:hypothetical protein